MIEVIGNIEDNINVIKVKGRIDSSNAPEFETKIAELDNDQKLILDIEELEYISSAGLRVILRLLKNHKDLEIKNASTEVYEIFDMTGFTEMMKIQRAYRRVSVEGCEVIGRGANGEVYRINPDTVVKVYLNPDSLQDIEHERDVARKALVLGIPTAISYDVVKVDDHYASMFEMINAKSFSKLLASNPENYKEYAKMYVDLMKLIHGTVVPEGQLPSQKVVTIGWVEFLKDHLPADVYEKLYKMVEEIPEDNHMIHGDYHTKNIMLQNNDEVMLIDMDTLATGNPVLELGSMYNAYLGFSILNHDDIKAFLGFDRELSEKFWHESVRLYYGSDDKEFLARKELQAQIIGMTRLLRRTIVRNGDKALIDRYYHDLCEAVLSVDSLID